MYRSVSIIRYRTMQIEVSYEYKMKNSFQLRQSEGQEWYISVKKNAAVVDKKFDRLCLFEFWELHSEARAPDPIKALKFIQRWGPLNDQPINRVPFTAMELVLRRMLDWKNKHSTSKLQDLFDSGSLKEHFDQKISISVAGSGDNLRPVLKPQNLEIAILLAGLIEGRQGYTRCHLHEVLGKPRDEDCPIGCWTRSDGRPGPKSRTWADDRCRAHFNRNKDKYKWS